MADNNASAINALLEKAGISPETTDVVLTVDALLQRWRRRAMRREMGHKALIDLKAGIDLAQLDVLIAIEGPTPEFGEASGETMIATVAERLGIDPSRASRVVSEMVERGFARRAVSQADARRTIIELTERGRALVDAVRAYKFLVMGDFFSGWSAEDLAVFVPLLQRFASWNEGMGRSAEKFADDIEELSKSIQAPR
ncbi:MarR family transcriptional regulator [Devosia sp. FJ2-5-3]|jgi:DNA-binding MarR family transcriptional regulator|uniref:MarR family winged helix-turn-helix transcriptional regulator n=1 Tax=Devosia sp. FJ2-5-3 TaxID=2976680 RepID=UPI0023D8AD7F|nr:MarR family transcriptional regulator [Devosia sp. FJ2-5-3]WEJ57418.1 MarR family transcriptional regulator [Devosia sp. FJ2-5-3]